MPKEERKAEAEPCEPCEPCAQLVRELGRKLRIPLLEELADCMLDCSVSEQEALRVIRILAGEKGQVFVDTVEGMKAQQGIKDESWKKVKETPKSKRLLEAAEKWARNYYSAMTKPEASPDSGSG